MHRLQQRLKVNKQALDSKDLHIGVLQKKIANLQERITSYNSTQSRVDSLEKKVCTDVWSCFHLLVYCCAPSCMHPCIPQLKLRCSQEEKLRTELARWSTAEHDLKENERSLLQLKVSMLCMCTFLADDINIELYKIYNMYTIVPCGVVHFILTCISSAWHE